MVASDDTQPTFDRAFTAPAGELVRVSPLVRRMVAGNAGPFTFTGTCCYVVGTGTVAVIDPGPDDAAHVARLAEALGGETISHIVVTHTHRDHSPGARLLAAATGAPIVGAGPHRAARPLNDAEAPRLDAGGDTAHVPAQQLAEGEAVTGAGWSLIAVETPGHTANHLAFHLPEENALFSGDHVMGWSTSVIAPPDGSMRDYMASLAKLRARPEFDVFWPGHGGPVANPARFMRGLVHHRHQREAAILNRLGAGDRTIADMVPKIYEGIDPRLFGAAGLSVFAHIEDLVERGVVAADEGVALGGRYRLSG